MNKDLEKLKREFNLFKVISLSVFLVLFGGIFNLVVLLTNDGKMPVRSYFNGEGKNHVFYEDITQASKWIFSDIIGFKYYILISIGDLLVFFGVGYLFIVLGKRSYQKAMERRWKKKQLSN